ncbi:MAG: hypothetical protein GY827_05300 [Cytophagales bacterium]|nr:hypothetical protein [Cytophagales bacterium]
MDKGGYNRKSYYHYTGEYNNILIYNQLKNKKQFLFDEKIFITDFTNHMIDSTHFLFIKATTKDSNKDQKLNEDDLREIFIYDLDHEKMHHFAFEGLNLYEFQIPFEENKVWMKFQVDKSNDGEIQSAKEPYITKELDLKTWKVTGFVSPEEIERLTELIN